MNYYLLEVVYRVADQVETLAMDIAEVIGDIHTEETFDDIGGTMHLVWSFPTREIRNVAYDLLDGVFEEGVVMDDVFSSGVVIERSELRDNPDA